MLGALTLFYRVRRPERPQILDTRMEDLLVLAPCLGVMLAPARSLKSTVEGINVWDSFRPGPPGGSGEPL